MGGAPTVTLLKFVVVEPLQPLAVTVTFAIPEKDSFQVTTPEAEMLPGDVASCDVIVHEYELTFVAEAVYVLLPLPWHLCSVPLGIETCPT
jgi:hypothetical protein